MVVVEIVLVVLDTRDGRGVDTSGVPESVFTSVESESSVSWTITGPLINREYKVLRAASFLASDMIEAEAGGGVGDLLDDGVGRVAGRRFDKMPVRVR